MSAFLEIIEWVDESRDTISFRFPDEDRAITRGAKLVVRESQAAQFVYLGQFGDTFGPGTHRLVTDNLPLLTRLRGWKYGFESPFKSDIYFVATRLFAGNTWGTTNPIMLRDADLGIVRVRAFGTYDFRVSDVKRFLSQVAGTDTHFQVSDFESAMRSRIVSAFSDALAASKIPVTDVASRYIELGKALLPLINPAIKEMYGLEMSTFVVENVSVPPEVEEAVDKRSSISAVRNLDEYVKFELAESLKRGGGAGLARVGAELAAGLSLGRQFAVQPSTTGSSGGAATMTVPEVLTPAQVAEVLRVTEADVLASLEAGDLEGLRVGNQWRITRNAMNAFLH